MLSDKIEALQQKQTSHAECISTMENKASDDYKKNSTDVSTIITNTSKELSEQGKDIAENVHHLVNLDTDFNNEMNTVINQYAETMEQQTASYDQIKVNTNGLIWLYVNKYSYLTFIICCRAPAVRVTPHQC